MNLGDLHPAEGARHPRKRIGRGIGSGHGKTSTRGHKGQKARAGGSIRPGFEGGQMPLQRRMPIRGFTPLEPKTVNVVNVGILAALGVSEITPDLLREKRVVRRPGPIKVLGSGDLSQKLTVRAHAFSESAKAKIEAAGGSCEVL
ncbi:MAG: 50S ribosomal protein L15 [Sulfobacillus sp.]